MRRPSGLRGRTGALAAGLLAAVALGLGSGAELEVAYDAVAPGLDYARVDLDGPVIAHVVRMDLKAKGLDLRSVKAKGKETVRELAARMEDADTKVLAAINGDFFRQDTAAGLPFGVQVADGRLIFAPMRRSMISFGPDHEPDIEIASLRARVIFAPKGNREGAKWTAIDDVNALEAETSDKKGIYLYTPAFLGLKLGRSKGLIAVVDAIEPALQVGDDCEGRVARVESTDQEVEVPESGCLLYFAGDTARSFAAKLKPGHTIALKLDLPPVDGNVTQAMGGGPRLVRNGKISVEIGDEDFSGGYAAEISKRHPRSAIGYDRAKRNLYLVMVEGRHDGSRGMTFGELANFLVKLGCYGAMAFDGGGSSALFVAEKGIVSQSMNGANQPEERAVANSLLITSAAKSAGK